MEIFTRTELQEIAGSFKGLCVSLFMPTHRAGPAIRQDPIRLKNLLRVAEERLTASGTRAPEARALLGRAYALLEDEQFWRHQSDGLALFVSADAFRLYRVPVTFDELVQVGRHFHITPLQPLLVADGLFYLLTLSQQGCRLLRSTRLLMDQVELPDAPATVDDAEGYERPETQMQVRAIAPKTSGAMTSPGSKSEFHTGKGNTAVVHGHGSSRDIDTGNLERYFRQIDASLMKVLHDESAPLVLAGVEYLLPIYRNLSRYPHILPQGILGSPEHVSDEELHARAWPLVEPVFKQAIRAAAEQFRESQPRGRASERLEEIVPASEARRVGTLFVRADVQMWGRYDSGRQHVEVHQEQQHGDEDLLNLAVIHTLLGAGSVYTVPADHMPTGSPIAAVYRY